MAVCSLFKKLTKTTGEFLMFSQWAEDLTKNHSYGYKYRAVPSKFITADLDFSKFKYAGTDSDLNILFPNHLQNYFENGCAVGKNRNIDEFDWDPNKATNLFWNTLLDSGLISIKYTGEEAYISNLNYVGDINIHS
jgi:hypothetical protein